MTLWIDCTVACPTINKLRWTKPLLSDDPCSVQFIQKAASGSLAFPSFIHVSSFYSTCAPSSPSTYVHVRVCVCECTSIGAITPTQQRISLVFVCLSLGLVVVRTYIVRTLYHREPSSLTETRLEVLPYTYPRTSFWPSTVVRRSTWEQRAPLSYFYSYI